MIQSQTLVVSAAGIGCVSRTKEWQHELEALWWLIVLRHDCGCHSCHCCSICSWAPTFTHYLHHHWLLCSDLSISIQPYASRRFSCLIPAFVYMIQSRWGLTLPRTGAHVYLLPYTGCLPWSMNDTAAECDIYNPPVSALLWKYSSGSLQVRGSPDGCVPLNHKMTHHACLLHL